MHGHKNITLTEQSIALNKSCYGLSKEQKGNIRRQSQLHVYQFYRLPHVECFYNSVDVLVICVLVFTVFCIVCAVFLYCFVYVYLLLFVLSVLV